MNSRMLSLTRFMSRAKHSGLLMRKLTSRTYEVTAEIVLRDIAYRFGETENEIEKRIRIISMMKENGDTDRSHFSYYDVLVRNRRDFKRRIMIENDRIAGGGSGGKSSNLHPRVRRTLNLLHLELRNKLPVILSKPKVLKKICSW